MHFSIYHFYHFYNHYYALLLLATTLKIVLLESSPSTNSAKVLHKKNKIKTLS